MIGETLAYKNQGCAGVEAFQFSSGINKQYSGGRNRGSVFVDLRSEYVRKFFLFDQWFHFVSPLRVSRNQHKYQLLKWRTQSLENIQKDISEGKVDMAENIGIKIDKENINIDLEKTKNFIEDLGKKIEGFIGEIDKAVDNIDKK